MKALSKRVFPALAGGLLLSAGPALAAEGGCPQTNAYFVFLDFDKSQNEADMTRASAEQNCLKFIQVKSKTQAREVFTRLSRENPDSVQLVLSGHSGSMGFSGTNFTMKRKELFAFLDSFPKVKSRMTAAYLLGCYTNNKEKVKKWLALVPGFKRIYGYDTKSPLDAQILGAEYAGRAVLHNAALEGLTSLKEVKQFIDQNIAQGSGGFFPVSAAIYGKLPCLEGKEGGEFYYVVENRLTTSSITNMTDFMAQCPEEKKNYEAIYKKQLADYWTGAKPIPRASSPEGKSEESNPIRYVVYPWANRFAHCVGSKFHVPKAEHYLNLGNILNLIFFHTVEKNFFHLFAQDVNAAKNALAQAHNPRASALAARIAAGQELERAEALQLYDDLAAFLRSPGKGLNQKQLSDLRTFHYRYGKYVRDLDDRCAGLDWIDELETQQGSAPICLSPRR